MARRGRTPWPPGPERQVFTTGEVARLCHVTIRTVINWIDSGQLQGYKIPGSRDRRIPRATVLEFMKAHGLPLGPLAEPAANRRPRVLVVDDEPEVVELIATYLESLDRFELQTATNGYEAGARTVAFRPDVLVIDYNLGDVTGLDVVRTVRSDPALAGLRIVCMSGFLAGPAVERVLREGVDAFVAKPLDLAELSRRIESLLPTSSSPPT